MNDKPLPAPNVATSVQPLRSRIVARCIGFIRSIPHGPRLAAFFFDVAAGGYARFRTRGSPLIVERSGIVYELNLSDDIARRIYFDVYDQGDLAESLACLRPGDTVIDAGANIGFYSLHCAKAVGESGQVHAFEPDPQCRATLARNCALNSFAKGIEIYPLALSGSEGQHTFYPSSTSHSGWGSLERFSDIAVGQMLVGTTTVDAVISGIGKSVRLLKVDVEGHEPELLRGAWRSMADALIDYVLIEYNGPRLAEVGWDWSRFAGLIEQVSYKRLQPETPPRPDAVVNCLFVSPQAARGS